MRIAGISSRKFDAGTEGELINHYLYNDKELFEDADLNWYDYGFRNYDAQNLSRRRRIARFTQLDPLTWEYPELTNYQYASDEPIANVDMDGLEGASSVVSKADFFLDGAKNIAVESLSPVVLVAKVKSVVKPLSFIEKTTKVLKDVGSGISWFAKGLWNEGMMPTVDWFNHNINPAYGIFNGINSQFTGQDFLSGEPMTRAQGVSDFALSVIPGMKLESAAVKEGERLFLKESEKVVSKKLKKFLPTLDATGKVHGDLPKVKDLANYSKEELQTLLGELKQSVKKRIKVTSKMGRDRAHGQRQGAEQDLIKSLEKYLGQ
ncbi:MAG: hypothetical protein J0H55_16395 [Chitinophagaceae bacterium]|nr:hypothetical protein [Chitinophagaceae bacterium]